MFHCGKPMIKGTFKIEQRGIPSKHSSLVYPVSTFYENDTMICEVPKDATIGYYCTECGMLIGVFPRTHPTGFAGEFNKDIDENIDVLPKKICSECGAEIDLDYPRCPFCGHIYEAI